MNWVKWTDKKPLAGTVVLVVHRGQLNIGVSYGSHVLSAINDRELNISHWIYIYI